MTGIKHSQKFIAIMCDQAESFDNFQTIPYEIDPENTDICHEIIGKYNRLYQNMNWEKTQNMINFVKTRSGEDQSFVAIVILAAINSDFNGPAPYVEETQSQSLPINVLLKISTDDGSILYPLIPLSTTFNFFNNLPCYEGYQCIGRKSDTINLITFEEPLSEPLSLTFRYSAVDWGCQVTIPANSTKWSFPTVIIHTWIFNGNLLIKGLPENATIWGGFMRMEDRQRNFHRCRWVN